MENNNLEQIEAKMKLIRHNPALVGEYMNLVKERREIASKDITRRIRTDLITSGEKSILDAMQEVGKWGADLRLTDAVIYLQNARDSIADFIDGVDRRYSLNDKLSDIRQVIGDNHPHEAMIGLIENILNSHG